MVTRSNYGEVKKVTNVSVEREMRQARLRLRDYQDHGMSFPAGVKTTPCRTVTNTLIIRTTHGIIRQEVRRPVR